MILLILGNALFERTIYGQSLDRWGDAAVQHSLTSSADPVVVVVDIGDITPERPIRFGRKITVTPRSPLRNIVTALAGLQPRAIGVDVDFAPDRGLYMSIKDDPAFFSSLLKLRSTSGVPIFLGTYRSMRAPPSHWLGSPEYSTLAASVALPTDKRMLFATIGTARSTGPTLSGALASAALRGSDDESESRRWPAWFASATTPWQDGRFSGDAYVADYSVAHALMRETFEASDAASVRTQYNRFHDRIVILGDATRGPNRPIPCVFMHAAGAYTLVQAPLFRMTWPARLLIDLLLCLLVLGTTTGTRLYYNQRAVADVATHRLQAAGFFVSLVVVVLIGLVVVSTTRVVWDDFVLVMLAFLIHGSVEKRTVWISNWLRSDALVLWKRFVFQQPSGRG